MRGEEKRNGGFILLHRAIKDNWIWADADKLKWWLDILLSVNYADADVLLGNVVVKCKRGQSIKSLPTWSKQWRVDIGKVRRFLDLLQDQKMIVKENVQKTTRITVCNYDSYNDMRHDNDTKTTRKRIPNELSMTSNKEEVNKKETIKDIPASIKDQSKTKLPEEDPAVYKSIDKTKEVIYDYIKKRPLFIEPYIDFWNLFAKEKGLSFISAITENRKIRLRIREQEFNFPEILRKAGQSEFMLSGSWFGFDWIIKNQDNYIKTLEGNYDNKKAPVIPINHNLSPTEEAGKEILNSIQ